MLEYYILLIVNVVWEWTMEGIPLILIYLEAVKHNIRILEYQITFNVRSVYCILEIEMFSPVQIVF
jgi:hypothetical protein